MTAGTPAPASAQPYIWDDDQRPPQDALRLWTEVANGLERNQTGKCFLDGMFSIMDSASHFVRAIFLVPDPRGNRRRMDLAAKSKRDLWK